VASEKAVGRGRTIVRFQQAYDGIPVVGGELVVQLNPDQDVLSVHGEVAPDLDLSTSPSLDAGSAQDLSRRAVAKWYGMDAARLVVSEPELWVYEPSLVGPGRGSPALVWRLEVTPVDLLPLRELVLVDAARGSVPLHFNQLPTVKFRQTFTANNGTFLPGSQLCSESAPCNSGDPHAVSAHQHAGDVYDFYASHHGRDSYDDLGGFIISTVHYDVDYYNAFWDGSRLVYGDGCNYPAADDVVAHEFTHGVTDHSSELFYYYQSGAINESLSDVWGELVDQTNDSGNDLPSVKWVLGEDITGPGCGPIRNMKNPPAFGDPDRMKSPHYYTGSGDDGGVHANSGINNKAAFLMTDGGNFNGRTVTGLGVDKVAKIYYEVQTNLLVSGSDYADLYDALNQACSNLVGSDGITSADCQEVRDAADAVEMSQSRPGLNAEAPVCGDVAVPQDLFMDNIDDSGGGNFSFQGIDGAWSLENFYATDGALHLWGDDSFTDADESAVMTTSVGLPTGSRPYLRFDHAFGFEEPNYDGGVLEYSTDAGTSWKDAGTLFDANGYNGTANSFNAAIAGRRAFVADSHGYISSRVKLASLAGQSVRFRWRLGTDFSFSDQGWFLDDIRIYTCSGGVLQFSGASYSVGEGGTQATITVTRTGSTDGIVEVSYATANGTAGDEDYAATSGVLNFASGVASRTFTVPVVNDTLDEDSETIELALTGPTNFAVLGAQDSATLTIADNDSGGTIQLDAAYSAGEAAGTAVIAVRRTAGAASDVTVHYATADGSAIAGSDYTSVSGTVSFDANETSRTFTVPILNDGQAEANETIQLVLTDPSGGAVLGVRDEALLTVNDDEIGLFFDAPGFSTSEASPAATITIRRSGPTGPAVGVSYAASDGTATAGLDFVAASGTVALGPGITIGTFTVPILPDTAVEGNEAAVLNLSSPTGGALLGQQSTSVLNIADNDPPVTLKLSAASYAVSEKGPAATITVTRSGPLTGTVDVSYATGDGTATLSGSDYGAASGTLSFGPGVKARTFAVPILEDTADEIDETITLALGSPTGGATLGSPSQAVLTIQDNDPGGTLRFGLAAYTANETSGSALITVTRLGGTASGVSVSYATSDGSATAGSDYTATSGTLNFAAGDRAESFLVPVLDDSDGEGVEVLQVALSSPTGGALLGAGKTADLKIVDDESAAAGMLQLGLAAYRVNEGGGSLRVSVSRTGGAKGSVSVDYATSEGSAAAGADYAQTSGTLPFGAGERSRSFVVPILNDSSGEGNETFSIVLSNPGGGAILGPRSSSPATIVDNEAALQFKLASFSATEGGPAAAIVVTRTGPSQPTVGVSYATSNGTAIAGSDYTAASGTLTFGPGVVSRSFTVPILNDRLDEDEEQVNLSLSNPTGGIVLGAQSAAVLKIADNDAGGTLQFKSASTSVGESGLTATVTVTRIGGSASGVTVDYASVGGSATPGEDYTAVSGTLTFGPAVRSRTFSIPIANDALDETNEIIQLALTNPLGGASLGVQSTSLVSITDEDTAGSTQFQLSGYSTSESASAVTITVTRTGGAAGDASVNFEVSGGSATAGSDYTATSGVLIFGASETSKTFTVSILEDGEDEENETVNLVLSAPSGGLSLGAEPTAVLFIVDNE
jgi:Zn-dependent metalloprotease